MGEPKTALMTVTGRGGPPTLAEAATQLGLGPADLDAGFGVVPVDPERNLFAVGVRADRVPPAAPGQAGEVYRGPFSNPEIAPFGPVQPAEPAKKGGR
ncbi:hypothetical protein PQJ75_24545 [Rhodoplanes sp. TEM]|uniref:Uncharacterized protein n=1 Tax=Rhodoplanes tepidamans TaxID=200616 RepID=A0ABT5JET6_RHOTP|nr:MULTISPECIES: hypothetical protein [Rhodoplanes]MDC7787938.1 hypothetical protein [Rhodoplanes tepidamans]MDC7986912.1 hypothetical protein [Rhodoplanes sp. TEM]MDQ0358367.1 hypothetical protein [Rhodoplanes tepidamans]